MLGNCQRFASAGLSANTVRNRCCRMYRWITSLLGASSSALWKSAHSQSGIGLSVSLKACANFFRPYLLPFNHPIFISFVGEKEKSQTLSIPGVSTCSLSKYFSLLCVFRLILTGSNLTPCVLANPTILDLFSGLLATLRFFAGDSFLIDWSLGLKVNNSMKLGELVDFIPHEGNLVRWYTCGPTVYDDSHLGHAR